MYTLSHDIVCVYFYDSHIINKYKESWAKYEQLAASHCPPNLPQKVVILGRLPPDADPRIWPAFHT